MSTSSLFHPVLNILFPPLCVHCGHEGAWLCAEAQALLQKEEVSNHGVRLLTVDRVLIRGEYDSPPLQAFIQKLKYQYWTGVQEEAVVLLKPVAEALGELPRDTVIIPVPLHRKRQRERGFNQSQLLAQALSELVDRPVASFLTRQRYTKAQATLDEAERKKNVVEAFALKPGNNKIPSTCILVDDVITTGSTINECASILRFLGTKRVFALALGKG